MKHLICAFAIGMALSSAGQAQLSGDIEIVPGGGSSTETYAPKFKDRSFAEGWCEGYKLAVQLVGRNRDHFMKMLAKPEAPFETHVEAMKRIYANASPREFPREEADVSSLVGRLVMNLRDGVDLYVVLPDLGGPMGSVTLKTEDGQTVECK